MSPLDLIFLIGAAIIVARIVRRLAQPGSDLVEQGRRAMGDLADGMGDLAEGMRPQQGKRAADEGTEPLRQQEVRHPPGPRSSPRVVNVTRPSVRPGNERTRVTRPGPARSPRATTRTTPTLDDWYLVLDVSPDATRREVQEALKLRLARARANRDGEAMRRVIRAAGAGMGQPQRGRSD